MGILSNTGGYRPVVRAASPDSERFFFIVVVLVIMVVASVGGFCGFYIIEDRQDPNYSCSIRFSLEGPVTIDEVFDALVLADFGLVDKEGSSPTASILFHPWCGQPNSSMQKNSAKEVKEAKIDIWEDLGGPNKTRGDVMVKGRRVNSYTEDDHEERMKCIGERLEDFFTKDLNFTLSSGRFNVRCSKLTPGFEAMALVGTAVTVALVRSRWRK